MRRAIVVLLLLGTAQAQSTAQGIMVKDEGVAKGRSQAVNCIGAGIVCGLTAGTWTITANGGSGGAPTGAYYVTTQADATLTNEVVLPTCTSTDKLTFNGTTITCAADQGGTYTLPALTASVLGGVKGTGTGLACTGSDKATGFDAAGALQCAADVRDLASDPTACGAGNYVTDISAAGALTCSIPPGTYSLPAASTTLGGTKMASACSAGNFVGSIGAGGELTCAAETAHAGTGEGYWVKTASTPLTNEVAMGGLGSGLILNTTTTGVPTIYGGTSCTNQFPRSLAASGAATCASVADADLTGTISQGKGGTGAGALTCTGGQHLTSNGTAYSCSADTTYTLPAAAAATLGGIKGTGTAIVCSGTDKATGWAADGTLQCGTDQTSAGGAYGTIQEEGSALTQRATVNFTGAGATCVDNAGSTRTDCTIPGHITTAATVTCANTGTAIPLTAELVEVTTDNDADLDNCTLANGTVGQKITIIAKVRGGTADTLQITPATSLVGTAINFPGNPLGMGVTLIYTSAGWAYADNVSGAMTAKVSGSNFTTTSTTGAAITGLSFALKSLTAYRVECSLSHTTSVATANVRFRLTATSPTTITYRVMTSTTSLTAQVSNMTATNSTLLPAAVSSSNLTTTLLTNLHGNIYNATGASGTMTVDAAVGSAATATVLIGSGCMVTPL